MYQFGEMRGTVDLVRVEEYRPGQLTVLDRLKARVAELKRWFNAMSRPSGETNAKALRAIASWHSATAISKAPSGSTGNTRDTIWPGCSPR